MPKVLKILAYSSTSLHFSAFYLTILSAKISGALYTTKDNNFHKHNYIIYRHIQNHTFPETPKTPIFQVFIMPYYATFIPKSDKNAHETLKILSSSLAANVRVQKK